MQIDSHTLGLSFFNKTLEGISNRMYGTKKMTSAVLYLLSCTRSSSSDRPKTFAFAMFTLESQSGEGPWFRSEHIPVEESQKIHDAQERYDVQIDLVYQSPFSGMGRALDQLGRIVIVGIVLRDGAIRAL